MSFRQFVSNAVQLSSHGERELRALALDVIEHALAASDPYHAVRERVTRDGEAILIDGQIVPLPAHGRVLFIGAGKASYPIAKAVEEILSDRLTEGLVSASTARAERSAAFDSSTRRILYPMRQAPEPRARWSHCSATPCQAISS